MPRTPKAYQELRDERRGALLRAATLVFAERGFARTKISEIATLAGVSHGLVYNYFASKEAIFDEILTDLMQARREPLDRILVQDSGQTVFEQICALTKEQLALLTQPEHQTHQLVVQAMMQGGVPEYIVRKLESHIASTQQLFCDWVVRGQKEGSIDKSQPAQVLTSAFFALLRGLWIKPISKHTVLFATTNCEVIMRLLAVTPDRSSKLKAPKLQKNKAAATRARAKLLKVES